MYLNSDRTRRTLHGLSVRFTKTTQPSIIGNPIIFTWALMESKTTGLNTSSATSSVARAVTGNPRYSFVPAKPVDNFCRLL